MSRKKKNCINCSECNEWAENFGITKEIPERCEDCPFYDNGEYECMTTYIYDEDEKMWTGALFENEYDEDYREQNDIDWLIEKMIESGLHFDTTFDKEQDLIFIGYDTEKDYITFVFDADGEFTGISNEL